MLATSKRNFFQPKIIFTGCTFGIDISDKKTIKSSPNCVGWDIKPYSLTSSPVTHCWILCSHVAGDCVNLSWLVGIGKPGMPLAPLLRCQVLPCMMAFTRKKCRPKVHEKKKTSPTLNSERLASAMTELEQRSSLLPITTDCRQASCSFRLPAASTLYMT